MVMAHMGEEDEKRREREKVRETVKGRDRKKERKKKPQRPVCNETYVLRWREMCVHASVNCVFEITVYLILRFSV